MAILPIERSDCRHPNTFPGEMVTIWSPREIPTTADASVRHENDALFSKESTLMVDSSRCVTNYCKMNSEVCVRRIVP